MFQFSSWLGAYSRELILEHYVVIGFYKGPDPPTSSATNRQPEQYTVRSKYMCTTVL